MVTLEMEITIDTNIKGRLSHVQYFNLHYVQK